MSRRETSDCSTGTMDALIMSGRGRIEHHALGLSPDAPQERILDAVNRNLQNSANEMVGAVCVGDGAEFAVDPPHGLALLTEMASSSEFYSDSPSRPLSTLVERACHLSARRIEYRTHTEEGASVYIVEIPRLPGLSAFDALIQLMSIELHWREGWDRAGTTATNAEVIVRTWILPALERRQFRESPIEDVRRKVDASVSDAIEFLQSSSSAPAAGIFIDDMRWEGSVADRLIADGIEMGSLLLDEWNDVDVLYASAQRFGRLTWGTSA